MGSNNTCKDCKDRHVGCHGECEAYIEWDRKHRAEKEEIWEKKQKVMRESRVIRESVDRVRKRKGKCR
jgi:hypothetical protein